MGGRVILVVILAAFLISISTVNAEPNLIGWWEFDEGGGSTAGDASGNGNDGWINSATWFADPCREMCLDFDGGDDYVAVDDSVSMRSIDGSAAEYTISLWIRTTQAGAELWDPPVIFDRRATNTLSGKNQWVALIYLNEYNAAGFYTRDNYGGSGGLELNDTLAINDDSWHHIAILRKGTDYVRIYVDGGLRQSGATTANTSTTEITTIGVRRINTTEKTGYFDGKIDDVRIYNRALSAGEIERLCNVYVAYSPNPADGATCVDPNTVLSWSPGEDANSHNVYLGTDYNDVIDANTSSAEYKGNFDVNSYDPCGLDAMTTYYWRIDEVNEPNIWKGGVWSFETARPVIELSATGFEFYAVEGGTDPNDQILGISNSGAGALDWETSEDCSWLSAEPNSGSSTGEVDDVNLSVDINGLAAGLYLCEFTVWDDNAVNSPQTVWVYLSVDAGGILLVPAEYGTIQAAIDASINGDTVIVAPGTYTGAGNRDLDFGGKAITVRSIDPENPSATVIDCEDEAGHRGFYFHSGEGPNSIVSGLTITRGSVTGDPAMGGGIYCEGSSPTIENCIITNNLARGDGGIEGSVEGKIASGGGICCTSDSDPMIIDCTISDNEALGGWGSWEEEGDVGAGGEAYGGGISCASGSDLDIENCDITGNTAKGGIGASADDSARGGDASGGGIYCASDSNASMENCTVTYNTAMGGQSGGYLRHGIGYGGGGYGQLVMKSCIVSYNEVEVGGEDGQSYTLYGGGLALTGNSEIRSCLVTRNDCVDEWITGVSEGVAITCMSESQVVISNCTIARHSASNRGPAVSLLSGVGSSLECKNSILWYNEEWDFRKTDPSSASFSYCCTQQIISGTGNIHVDPCFIDVYADNLHLKRYVSPCYNTGDPNYTAEPNETDIDGESRVIDGRVDMGADEAGDCMTETNPDYAEWVSVGEPNCWCYQYQCNGDADGKKQLVFWVYTNDLSILKSAYAKPGTPPNNGICADFDHKKQLVFRVYSNDLAILKSYYAKPSVPSCGTPPDENFIFWIVP